MAGSLPSICGRLRGEVRLQSAIRPPNRRRRPPIGSGRPSRGAGPSPIPQSGDMRAGPPPEARRRGRINERGGGALAPGQLPGSRLRGIPVLDSGRPRQGAVRVQPWLHIPHACRSLRWCRPVRAEPVRRTRSTRRYNRTGGPRPHAHRLDAPAAGSRCPLRPPDAALESQDAPVTSSPSATGSTSSTSPRPSRAWTPPSSSSRDTVASGDTILFVGHQEAGPGAHRRRGGARRHAVRQPALAGRHADQLRDHPASVSACSTSSRHASRTATSSGCPRRKHRELTDEMTRLQRTLGGIRSMRRLPGAMFVDRPAARAHRRGRGAQARDPRHRHRRHQRRPGHARLHHPRQRRRDPRHPAALSPRLRGGDRGCRPASSPARPSR